MGVDAKGRAGHQRAKVISYFSLEKCGVIREHCLDLVDLISQFLAEYIKEKNVSLFQPIQIRKHLLGCHTGMGSEDTVGALTTYWQRAAQ